MTDLLFDVPETPSPRLAWLKRHGVTTELRHDGWRAFTGRREDKSAIFYTGLASGETEDEAIVALAKSLGLKLWNEEP